MPKRDVHYVEIKCDRCGKIIRVDSKMSFKYLLRIFKFVKLWIGKQWCYGTTDVYLCEDCIDDLEIWLNMLREKKEGAQEE